jgi:tify domain
MESPPGQLTIFYDGQISVYEGISPDKVPNQLTRSNW